MLNWMRSPVSTAVSSFTRVDSSEVRRFFSNQLEFTTDMSPMCPGHKTKEGAMQMAIKALAL